MDRFWKRSGIALGFKRGDVHNQPGYQPDDCAGLARSRLARPPQLVVGCCRVARAGLENGVRATRDTRGSPAFYDFSSELQADSREHRGRRRGPRALSRSPFR